MENKQFVYKVADEKQNVELGAGCGEFGKKFIPNCLITEKHKNPHCTINHIEYYCDATDTKLPSKRFKGVYLCNPYNFGFKKSNNHGLLLLTEINRLLSFGGRVYIIASSRSRWCNPSIIESRISEFNSQFGTNYKIKKDTFTTSELEEIYPKHIFLTASNNSRAFPYFKIEIYATQ